MGSHDHAGVLPCRGASTGWAWGGVGTEASAAAGAALSSRCPRLGAPLLAAAGLGRHKPRGTDHGPPSLPSQGPQARELTMRSLSVRVLVGCLLAAAGAAAATAAEQGPSFSRKQD